MKTSLCAKVNLTCSSLKLKTKSSLKLFYQRDFEYKEAQLNLIKVQFSNVRQSSLVILEIFKLDFQISDKKTHKKNNAQNNPTLQRMVASNNSKSSHKTNSVIPATVWEIILVMHLSFGQPHLLVQKRKVVVFMFLKMAFHCLSGFFFVAAGAEGAERGKNYSRAQSTRGRASRPSSLRLIPTFSSPFGAWHAG